MSVIQANDAVLVHLEIKLKDGSVAESTKGGKPTKLQLGDGSLSEAIEAHIVGQNLGDKITFEVAPKDGFGEHNQSLVQHMERHMFGSDMDVSVGSIIAFANPAGGEMPGVISAVHGSSITVDFNHPLAGHLLRFDIEVLEINP